MPLDLSQAQPFSAYNPYGTGPLRPRPALGMPPVDPVADRPRNPVQVVPPPNGNQPAVAPMPSVKTEAGMRDAVAATPAEQAASAAYEASPGNLAELRQAIASEKDAGNKAILQQELDRQTNAGGAQAAGPVKWSTVIADPDFQKLDDAGKEQVRQRYFSNVVIPNTPTDQIEDVKKLFDERTKSSADSRVSSDLLKNLWASTASGTAQGARGFADRLADLHRLYPNPIIGAFGSWLSGQLRGSSDDLSQAADQLKGTMSEQGQRAEAGVAPSGDLTKPETWSLGKAPSLEGYAHLAISLFGSLAPTFALGGEGAPALLGAQFGGQSSQSAEKTIGAIKDEDLAKTPMYKALLDKGETPEQARSDVTNAAALMAGKYGAAAGVIGGKAIGGLMSKAGSEWLAAKVANSTIGRMALGSALGGTEGAALMGGQKVSENLAINQATGETTVQPGEGTFGAAALGAAAGGAAGAIRGAIPPSNAPAPSRAPAGDAGGSPSGDAALALEGPVIRPDNWEVLDGQQLLTGPDGHPLPPSVPLLPAPQGPQPIMVDSHGNAAPQPAAARAEALTRQAEHDQRVMQQRSAYQAARIERANMGLTPDVLDAQYAREQHEAQSTPEAPSDGQAKTQGPAGPGAAAGPEPDVLRPGVLPAGDRAGEGAGAEGGRRNGGGQDGGGPDERAAARQQGRASELSGRVPVNPDAHPVTLTGIHYTDADSVGALQPRLGGTKTPGGEQERVQGTRLARRTNFYIKDGEQMPVGESIVTGRNAYSAELSNLYDHANHPDPEVARIAAKRRAMGEKPANAFEHAVIDAGYDGYVADFPVAGKPQRAAVVLDTPGIPVKRAGERPAMPKAGASVPDGPVKWGLLSKEIPEVQDALPELQQAAPSARVVAGTLRVNRDEIPALNRAARVRLGRDLVPEEGVPDAAREVPKQESRQPEHQDGDGGRTTAEAGGGNRPERAAEGGEQGREAAQEPRTLTPEEIDRQERAERVLDGFRSVYKGANKLDIQWSHTADDLPADAVQSKGNSEAWYDRNTGAVHIVLDNLLKDRGKFDGRRLAEVLAHEIVGHHGVESLFHGAEFTSLLRDVRNAMRAEGPLKLNAEGQVSIGDKNYATVEAVRKLYPKASENEVAMEVLARLAETGRKPGFIDRLVIVANRVLRPIFKAVGADKPLTKAEVLGIVESARRHVQRGENEVLSPADAGKMSAIQGGEQANSRAAYEVAPNPDDKAATDKWNAKTPEERSAKTYSVDEEAFPLIAKAVGLKENDFKVIRTFGGFEGETNPSVVRVAESVPDDKLRLLAQAINSAYNQKSTMILLNAPSNDSMSSGMLHIEIDRHMDEPMARAIYQAIMADPANGWVQGFTGYGDRIDIVNVGSDITPQMKDGVQRALEASTIEGYGDVKRGTPVNVEFVEGRPHEDQNPAGLGVHEAGSAVGDGAGQVDRAQLEAARSVVSRKLADSRSPGGRDDGAFNLDRNDEDFGKPADDVGEVDRAIGFMSRLKGMTPERVRETWGYEDSKEYVKLARAMGMDADKGLSAEDKDAIRSEFEDALNAHRAGDETMRQEGHDYSNSLRDVDPEIIKSMGLHAEDAFPWIEHYRPTVDSYGQRRMEAHVFGHDGRRDSAMLEHDTDRDVWHAMPPELEGPGAALSWRRLSEGAARAYNRRITASSELFRRGFDLLSSVPPKSAANVVRVWRKVAQMPKAFEFATDIGLPGAGSSMERMNDIADQLLGKDSPIKIEVKNQSSSGRFYRVDITDAKGEVHEAELEFQGDRDRRSFVVHAAGLNEGSGVGKVLYQFAAAVADYFKAPIKADSAGLLGINTYRRTEQMLSAAARLGKAGPMLPGTGQRIYGWDGNPKNAKAADQNFARIALASLRNVGEIVPEFRTGDITYDLAKDRFMLRGQDAEPLIDDILGRKDVRSASISRSTLARAAITSEAIAGKDPTTGKGTAAKPVLYSRSPGERVDPEAKVEKWEPRPEIASTIGKYIRNLTDPEAKKLRIDTAQRMVDILHGMPTANEFAAAAWAGKEARGWYESATKAISHVFGPDAPRFTALLASMSPQTSVESNLTNAIKVWRGWVDAGRPTDEAAIRRVMARSGLGDRGEDSVLRAWSENSVRSLSSDDPASLVLSGPKVDSFMRNLLGNVHEVTNDAWMSYFAEVDQRIFGGRLHESIGDPGKGAGYLAMNARVREAANVLTNLTGEQWTPRDVQETIWSWAKTLYEHAGADRSAESIVRDRALTDDLLRATPDFATLLHDDTNARLLEQAGLGDQLYHLDVGRGDEAAGGEAARAGGKAAPFAESTQVRHERAAAQRLDRLRQRGVEEAQSRSPGDRAEQRKGWRDWVERAWMRKPTEDAAVLSERAPHDALLMGKENPFGRDQPVVMTPDVVQHIRNTHEADGVTRQMVENLPDLLERPRAIIYRNGVMEVVLPERDARGAPVLVVLKKQTLGNRTQQLKVTRMATMFPKKDSAAFIADAMKNGSQVWLPSEGVSRLRMLLRAGTNYHPPGDHPGLAQPGRPAPTRQSTVSPTETVGSVLSDEALRKFQAGDKSWPKATESIPIPSDFRGRLDGVNFSLSPGERIFQPSGRKYTPEEEEAISHIGGVVKDRTMAERFAEARKDWSKKLAQGLVDQFRPLKDLGAGGESAYALARLSKGSAGAFEALLYHGKLKVNADGSYDADTSGGALQKLFTPLGNESMDFLRWIAANRAERLAGEGREHLFRPQDIAALKGLNQGQSTHDYTIQNGPNAGQVTRDRAVIYRDALKTYDGINRNVLDVAEKSGLINADGRSAWEHEMYVPFYRVMGDDEFNPTAGGGLVRKKAFEQLKGGKEQLKADLIDNVMQNWARLVDASAKNRAALESLKAAADMGVANEVPESTGKQMAASAGMKKALTWAMDDGVKHFYVVGDPMVLKAISSIQYPGLKGPIMTALSAPKHWLTMGVTSSPGFKVRNLIRDSLQAVSLADLSPNILRTWKEGYEGTKHSSPNYVSALAGGGLIRFGTMLEGGYADRIRQLVKQARRDGTLVENEAAWRKLYDRYFEPLIEHYNEIGNVSEEINRAALYKRLIAKGVDPAQANLAARDLLDFSMGGTWTTVRFLTQVVPFMNARLQGLYKIGRGAAEYPKRFAAVLGATALGSIALSAAYHDDEDWKKREDWDKDNFWWFKLGKLAFRIPKPFELGSIAALAERGSEFLWDKDMTGKRYGQIVRDLLMDNLSMNPIPQAVKPLLDIYSNQDSFTGRAIESGGMEKQLPDYRYTIDSSMTGRAASTVGNKVAGVLGGSFLSPVQIDHLVQGYFGWLGSFVNGGADMLVRSMANEPTRPALDWFKVASQGMVAKPESSGSYYVTSMYQQAKQLEQAYGTWTQMLRTGQGARAQEFLANNKDSIMGYGKIEGAKAATAGLNSIMRIEEQSSDDADEKRRKINDLRARQNAIASGVIAHH